MPLYNFASTILSLLVVLLLLFDYPVIASATQTAPTVPFSVSFYYAANPPLDELQVFDVVVVDPDAVGVSPQAYKTGRSELFAYVSVGEADPRRSFYRAIKPEWLLGDNQAWNSKLVDLANPDWRLFFLEQVVEPLWQKGYRGFFLDTLDSFMLVKDTTRHAALREGLAELLHTLKQRHPEARLIFNRGFEVLDQAKRHAFAVAAESLFQTFDPVSGSYGEVKEADRQWLRAKFDELKAAGIPTIAIEYVPPGKRALARTTADRVLKLGSIPWVADGGLASLGVGAVEVVPRNIIGLYDSSEGPDPVYTNLQRFAVMPLNYLGYQVKLYDLRQPLPTGILKGRYAGVVIWPNADSSGMQQGLLEWVVRQKNDGVPLVFLDRFGVSLQRAVEALDGSASPAQPLAEPIRILHHDQLVGYETQPLFPNGGLQPLRFERSTPLLAFSTVAGAVREPVAITPWGGYALDPYVVNELVNDRARWVIDPFSFFTRALQLEPLPAPDVTTENGYRLLLVHIDADGFESRVERPSGPFAATELRERILEKYRIPTTYSVITSILGDRGVNQTNASVLQQEARKIFRSPWVEAGSHTFSHPFYWKTTAVTRRDYQAQYLPIPGYTFSLEVEIPGSIRFMEEQLLPPGKKVRLLQWSGNCLPDAEAVALTYRSGVGNINGGDTKITESNRSLTAVAPLGLYRDSWFQVFAPNQNENVYTKNWTDFFYGYRRVIETFKLTETPRRLKPINIYYHNYSVTKEASRRALEDVYDWALAQKPYSIYTSEYVAKVLDFNRTAVARSGEGWLIVNNGHLRQVRLPVNAGYPDLEASRGVMGFHDHDDQRYIHLASGGNSYLRLTPTPPSIPWLAGVSARVEQYRWHAYGIKMRVTAYHEADIVFKNAGACRLLHNGMQTEIKPVDGTLSFRIPAGSHRIELACRN